MRAQRRTSAVSSLLVGLGLVFLSGCSSADDPGPLLGMVLAKDGVIYAGVAVVDITPALGETFTDVNGNHDFDGCLDQPAGGGGGCDEPFDDTNGNGSFDPVWIGGFGPKRPMLGVHDPIDVRALVLSYDESYLALVSIDVVGLGSPRIHEARDRLVAEGFDRDRLLVASSHNHEGPDTMGLWGDPNVFVSGLSHEYQARLADSIESAVRSAASTMVPVSIELGSARMREVDPKWFNGANFGGKNPSAIMHGLIHDGRDPVVVSDQLLVLRGVGGDGASTVFTLTNWSGHPETRSSSNNEISSDYVGTLRGVLEGALGGVAMHLPECLGGMQSALSGDVPLVNDSGERQFQSCDAMAVADAMDMECFGKSAGDPRIDADGDPVPMWAERDSWEFVRSLGWHLAEAALDALDRGETVTQSALRVEAESLYLPVENRTYNLLAPFHIFELGLEDAVFDPSLCPEAAAGSLPLGCLEVRTFRVQLGPVGFTAVPGELLPEMAWGFPEDDPRWAVEVDDPLARGQAAMAVYFPQHDPNCNDVTYSACQEELTLADCDCRQIHAWPYLLSDDPSQRPLLEAWSDTPDVRYRAVIGMADNYLSYIIPEPDFNVAVSLLENDGDHYEDTVSPAHVFGTRLQEAQRRIDARWSGAP